MKKTLQLIIALLISINTWAQAPEKMSYQAVIRDTENNLVVNQNLGIQVSVLKGGQSGTAVYVERQTPTTNANGLVSLEIGTGNVSTGVFSNIDWSNDTYFIKTETDITGGTNYTITGTSQMMSVPYALYAKTSGSSSSNLPQTPTAGDMTYWNGSSWDKVAAPSESSMVLTYCEDKPVWTKDGKCPIKVGTRAEGGIVYKIFQNGDTGYVEGETHGLVASSTQARVPYSQSGNYVNALNEGTYNNWHMPSVAELVEIRGTVGNQNFFAYDYHWSTYSSSYATQELANPTFGEGNTYQNWSHSFSVLCVREF
ncbi:hypothetical protein FHR24_002526 [Wenyingzhuangia heitensis]|uniref:DUF1566 domain-containing protein n=1 Tax=Wenyingzhuangia heitensis TaxID=1487859 RepID=A0ABX0UB54_9FLAO|nr:hypothetical protein [Wenyingzhuangia heitensis]NIJ46048.1 hypothetical protein [Wenyingzhuangia heitensis]